MDDHMHAHIATRSNAAQQKSGHGLSAPFALSSARYITNPLLLSVFAIAARYSAEAILPRKDKLWDAGCDYSDQAHNMLGGEIPSIGLLIN
jgi:hypothetical protein